MKIIDYKVYSESEIRKSINEYVSKILKAKQKSNLFKFQQDKK